MSTRPRKTRAASVPARQHLATIAEPPPRQRRELSRLMMLLGTSALLAPAIAWAHTSAIGYVVGNTSNALTDVTIYYGTYHTGTNYTEGSLQFYKGGTVANGAITGGSILMTTPFTIVTTTRPAGLVDGVNNFYSDGTALVGTSPGSYLDSQAWQGVTVTGLAAGSYQFVYVPIAQPTLEWQPWDNIIGANAFTLSASGQVNLGGGSPPPPPLPDITSGVSSSLAQLGVTVNRTFDGGTLIGTGSDGGDFTITSKGGTVDTTGGTLQLTGILSDGAGGGGKLVVISTGPDGVLQLRGVNTWSGGVQVGPGATLDILSGAALGTGTLELAGTATLAARLLVSATTTITNPVLLAGDPVISVPTGTTVMMTGSITDGASPGDLELTGGGTLVLAPAAGPGANTYSGGTVITSGTLQAGTVNALPVSGSVSIAAGSTFDLAGFNQTIGTLSGAGATTLGSATLTLGAASGNYAGTISGSGGLAVTGGSMILTGANTYTGGTVIAPGGNLHLGNGGVTGSIAGNVTNDGALVFKRANDVTFGGVLSGSGTVEQAGTGTLVLNGINTLTGTMNVTSGRVVVGDATHTGARYAGGVAVASEATLAGYGTIAGGVANAGTVSPGGSVGTLTVGSYTQAAGGRLHISVEPVAASRLVVAGNASLNGTLAATFGPGAYAAQVIPVVTAVGVAGTFADYTPVNLPNGFATGVAYGATSAAIVLAPTSTATVYSSLNTQAIESGHGFARSMLQILSVSNACRDGSAQVGGRSVCGQHNHAWMTAFGGIGSIGNSGIGGFSTSNSGVMGGADHTFAGGIVAGFAGQVWQDQTTLSASSASNAKTSNVALGLYGRLPVGPMKFDLAAYYATTTSATVKRDTLGGGVASSSPSGQGGGMSAVVSYELMDGMVAPFVGLEYARFSRAGSSETGVGPLGLTVGSASTDSMRATAGVRLQHSFQLGQTTVVPQAWLGVEQQINHSSTTTSARLMMSQTTGFTVGGRTPDRTAAVMEIRVGAKVTDAFQLFATAGGRVGASSAQGQFGFGGQLRF